MENVNPPTLLFLFKIVLAVFNPWSFHMNFRVSLSICTECLDSDRDCVDSVGHFETRAFLSPSPTVSHLVFTKALGGKSCFPLIVQMKKLRAREVKTLN